MCSGSGCMSLPVLVCDYVNDMIIHACICNVYTCLLLLEKVDSFSDVLDLVDSESTPARMANFLP